MPSKKPLSASKVRAASLRELLLTTLEMAKAKGRYTHNGVITTFIDLPEAKTLLDEERMLWLRTAASKILADAIRHASRENTEQYLLPGVTVELAEDYTVPVAPDGEGVDIDDGEEGDLYHVARSVLLVGEHLAHVEMRRQQQNADEAVLTREERTAAILKAAGAGPGERVVDVLRRLARPH